MGFTIAKYYYWRKIYVSKNRFKEPQSHLFIDSCPWVLGSYSDEFLLVIVLPGKRNTPGAFFPLGARPTSLFIKSHVNSEKSQAHVIPRVHYISFFP